LHFFRLAALSSTFELFYVPLRVSSDTSTRGKWSSYAILVRDGTESLGIGFGQREKSEL
jgi:hypothetical protein